MNLWQGSEIGVQLQEIRLRGRNIKMDLVTTDLIKTENIKNTFVIYYIDYPGKYFWEYGRCHQKYGFPGNYYRTDINSNNYLKNKYRYILSNQIKILKSVLGINRILYDFDLYKPIYKPINLPFIFNLKKYIDSGFIPKKFYPIERTMDLKDVVHEDLKKSMVEYVDWNMIECHIPVSLLSYLDQSLKLKRFNLPEEDLEEIRLILAFLKELNTDRGGDIEFHDYISNLTDKMIDELKSGVMKEKLK
jgi:hypothetical protein